ncbi:hypothetical protein SDC9_06072 [bioreactor metagenome]|uniref:FHA domain-containing protein n=1 Tax=bioreactor metagenome TaxID=1076179 RepID=A0A644T3J7_9ZZZZ|nr:DUF3662 and FHA domain-containing protein [Negativicutes bacterium]
MMKIVRNLENFFEKYIEGFFNKKFESGLQPVEIAKYLLRDMEDQRSIGISHIYVPNLYQVYLNKEDYEHLSPYSKAIQQELTQYVKDEARERGYTIVGKPVVQISSSDELGNNKFKVACNFTEPIPNDSPPESVSPEELSDTRVFTKLPNESNKLHSSIASTLTVVEGLDAGEKFNLGTNRINMGRRESNELPLADLNTSRLHSYIVFEENHHILYDAKSLNGTYVNGHRVTRWRLRSGDRIRLGNTIILYEVN